MDRCTEQAIYEFHVDDSEAFLEIAVRLPFGGMLKKEVFYCDHGIDVHDKYPVCACNWLSSQPPPRPTLLVQCN